MKSIFCIFSMMVMSVMTSIAAEAPKETASKLDTILQACKDSDVDKFKSVCDEKMKKVVTPKLLEQINEVLKDGYKTSYFGMLDRVDYKTHYWKLDSDKDGVVDLLVEMSIIDGEVAGFYLK